MNSMTTCDSGQCESASPEVSILPYESLDDRQMIISGERFPEFCMVICDDCYWCCTCFNARGLIAICPICHKQTSKIPLTIEENCKISYNPDHGLIMRFGRKLPLR